MNHARESLSNGIDLHDTASHLISEAIHFHHAARNGGLHLLHHAFNVHRCGSGLIGKATNFTRNHQEALAAFASFFRLNRCVHRKHIGLVRDLGDGDHNRVNVGSLLVDR